MPDLDSVSNAIGWGFGVAAAVAISTALIANWRHVLTFLLVITIAFGALALVGFIARWAWENFVQWWLN